jgi:hypothetical protein
MSYRGLRYAALAGQASGLDWTSRDEWTVNAAAAAQQPTMP